jgi:hypothetical protein
MVLKRDAMRCDAMQCDAMLDSAVKKNFFSVKCLFVVLFVRRRIDRLALLPPCFVDMIEALI